MEILMFKCMWIINSGCSLEAYHWLVHLTWRRWSQEQGSNRVLMHQTHYGQRQYSWPLCTLCESCMQDWAKLGWNLTNSDWLILYGLMCGWVHRQAGTGEPFVPCGDIIMQAWLKLGWNLTKSDWSILYGLMYDLISVK